MEMRKELNQKLNKVLEDSMILSQKLSELKSLETDLLQSLIDTAAYDYNDTVLAYEKSKSIITDIFFDWGEIQYRVEPFDKTILISIVSEKDIRKEEE
jgi:hypothetical protein